MGEPDEFALHPDALGVRRLGIFGGSFDPVHAGHLHAARLARAFFGLEHLLLVPAARSPHKSAQAPARAADRIALLRTAFEGERGWSIWGGELEREGPSYSIDTVDELARRRRNLVGGRLYLIIGGDNLSQLHSWRRLQDMLELVQPIVIHREANDFELSPELREACTEPQLARLRRGLVSALPVEVSSTELREQLARGEDPGVDLPPGVFEAIRSRGLYRRG